MKNKISVFIFIFIFNILSQIAIAAVETPEIAFNGIYSAGDILKNIDFLDLQDGNPWPKEAVYTSGALQIMKGYGNRNFGRYNNLTKEQALALAYRAAGREAEAQAEAEKFGAANPTVVKGQGPDKYWANGYYALAVKDALITQNDYLTLTNPTMVPLNLPNLTFNRDANANRQEFAYYLGKQLKSTGIRGQEKLFNNFNDWSSVDPEKIPYIEDMLLKGILNGDGRGNLKPKSSITREQAAAMIKNSVDYLDPVIVSKRYFGTIENINNINDKTYPGILTDRLIDIRNSNGKLHTISINQIVDTYKLGKNELTGRNNKPKDKDIVVYKDGEIGNSSLLEGKEQIEYLADSANNIRFVKVFSSKESIKYVLARVDKIDPAKSTAHILELAELEYPDAYIAMDKYKFKNNQPIEKFAMKTDVPVYINGEKKDLTVVLPQKTYLFTIVNDIVMEIKNIKQGTSPKENEIIRGIVEDSNPGLKYITLFDQDGTTPDKITNTRKIELLKTSDMEITKNNKAAKLDNIEPGDRVFIRTDANGNVVSISAVDNYNKKIGKVLYYKEGLLGVEFDDNSQQIFKVESDIPVFEDGIQKGVNAIEAGDRVRLLVRESNNEQVLKEITIEGVEHYITDIYKGNFFDYDLDKKTLTGENVEILKSYGFERVGQKGLKTMNVGSEIKVYKDNNEVPIENVNKNDKGKIIYMAVEKDYLNDEKVVFLAVKDSFESERVLSKDSVSYQDAGSNTVEQGGFKMDFRNDTLCVKKDRLVKSQNIFDGDKALVIMNRNFTTKSDYAGIVKVDDNIDRSLQIFRVKISEIQEEKNFTASSYSVWNPDTYAWEYTAVPKVFELRPSTRILSSKGVDNNKLFVDYGDTSYKDKYEYVVSDGVVADEVNELDYTVDVLKGKIFQFTPEQDVLSTEKRVSPTSFKVRTVSTYDTTNLLWTDVADTEIKLAKNTIILKKGKRISADDLRLNDQLKILKKDTNALIIFVENG